MSIALTTLHLSIDMYCVDLPDYDSACTAQLYPTTLCFSTSVFLNTARSFISAFLLSDCCLPSCAPALFIFHIQALILVQKKPLKTVM